MSETKLSNQKLGVTIFDILELCYMVTILINDFS